MDELQVQGHKGALGKHSKLHTHLVDREKNKKEEFIATALLFSLFVTIFLGITFITTQQYFEKKFEGKFYPGVSIDSVDVSVKPKELAQEYFASVKNTIEQSTVTFTHDNTPVATVSATTLGIVYPYEEALEKAYGIGRSGSYFDKVLATITHALGNQTENVSLAIRMNTAATRELTASIAAQLYIAPKDAVFEEKDGKITTLIMHENGRTIAEEDIMYAVQKTFSKPQAVTGENIIPLTTRVLYPQKQLKDVNSYGIEEYLGEGKSDYSHSIPNRIYNLSLAASRVSGSLLPPGQIISYNKLVGEVSAKTGYRPAYVISQGRTVLGDGGGVCQVSTTFFRGAMAIGLPIVERKAHSYRVSYYENDAKPGLDATVFAPSVDLKVKNDTPSYIAVIAENDVKNKILRFKFYGKSDGRVATITEPVVWDVTRPPPPIYEEDPTLKQGVTKQVDFAVGGAKSKFTYTVKRNGEVIYEKTFLSVYRPWPAVYKVGTAL